MVLAVACSALRRLRSAAEPRAVIELFTSQGCSSCPAADKLLGELAQRSVAHRAEPAGRLLGLSRLEGHAGDCTGTPSGSALTRSARGDREVYTPQVVVNGAVHVLGSDKAAIERAIAQTAQRARCALPVTLTVEDGKVTVTLPAATTSATAREVWLCPVSSKRAGRSRPRREQRPQPSPITTSCGAGSSSATGPAKRRTFTVPLAGCAAARTSIVSRSWCKRRLLRSRARCSAPRVGLR